MKCMKIGRQNQYTRNSNLENEIEVSCIEMYC